MLIKLFIAVINFIYFFIKLAPTRSRKITMISRESNEETLDFHLLREQLESDGYEVKVLCRTFDNKVLYFFHMLKQMHHIATSRVVVLDTYCIAISVLKHKADLKVIQIWHSGAAIKKFGLQSVGKEGGRDAALANSMHMHENYDYIVAPSKETGRYFCEAFGYPESVLRIYALPRMQYLYEKRRALKQSVDAQSNIEVGRARTINVLYAPTFRRTGIVEMKPLIDAMSSVNIHRPNFRLIVSPHPLDTNDYSSVCEGKAELVHNNTYELLTECDVLISDYSSLVVEAAVLGIPMFIYAYDRAEYQEKNGLNIDLTSGEAKALTFEDAGELAHELEYILANGVERNSEATKAFCDRFMEADWKNATADLARFIIMQEN